MRVHPAVIVHGPADASLTLSFGAPVTLLSAPGAAMFAGCLWWQALVANASAAFPDTEVLDILDCADASAAALGALRSGITRLVLWPEAPGWSRVAAITERREGVLLTHAPPALDLAQRGASRHLPRWLQGESLPRT